MMGGCQPGIFGAGRKLLILPLVGRMILITENNTFVDLNVSTVKTGKKIPYIAEPGSEIRFITGCVKPIRCMQAATGLIPGCQT